MAQTRKEQLESALQKAAALTRIAQSTDFIQYLRPYLEKLSSPEVIESSSFKTEEEYIHALKESNTRAKVHKEFLTFFDSQEGKMKTIREELEKPTKSYGI